MVDSDVRDRINRLSEEEEGLYEQAGHTDGLTGAQVERLQVIREELDQAYDLLHQREARRNAGMDPGEAVTRPPDVVERYLQ